MVMGVLLQFDTSSCGASADRPFGARSKRRWMTHDRGFGRDAPRAFRPEIRRPAASILRVFARPTHVPLETRRRREQWFGKRWTIEFWAEIDDQQALVRWRVITLAALKFHKRVT